MFANHHAPVDSVTSDPLAFLDDAHDKYKLVDWTRPKPEDFRGPFWEAMGQKRADKSASSDEVKKLLLAAAAGGMTQKDFETGVSVLRPSKRTDVDSKIQRKEGYRGALWHYYVTESAQMSLLALVEYADYFQDQGWLTKAQHDDCLDYVAKKLSSLANVKKMFPVHFHDSYESMWRS